MFVRPRHAFMLVFALTACQQAGVGTSTGAGEPNHAGGEPAQQGNVGAGLGPAGPAGPGPAPAGSGQPAVGGGNAAPGQQGNVVPAAGGGNLPSSANYRFLGRVPASRALTWPGTGVEASFTGTQGTATFNVLSGTSYVGVSVDGGNATRVQVQQNVPIAFGPVDRGAHRVRFVKLNEAELGSIVLTALRSDGTTVATASPNRLLEFVGDSITLGYGVEGTRPCKNSSALENVLKAWSGLAAGQLNADASIVAWSGHGMLRNAAGVSDLATMPQIYLRASATDATSRFAFGTAPQPQAVVVALGTNDFTYVSDSNRAVLDQAAFTAAYLQFVQQVRANYPNAVLVLAGSPMLSDTYPSAAEAQHSSLLSCLTAVQTQLGDARVRVLDLPTMDTTVSACDYHPSAAEQQAMSELLVTELRTALGW